MELDWSKRLPGEQWLVLDSAQTADAYLSQLPAHSQIAYHPYPNAENLYASFSAPGQVFRHRIYVPISENR